MSKMSTRVASGIGTVAITAGLLGGLGAGSANAFPGLGAPGGYCSPSVGCTGGSGPVTGPPDETTFRGRLACAGGVAFTAFAPEFSFLGLGLSVVGC